MTQLVRETAELRAWRAAQRRAGERLALVPTMGYLHEGHLALMRAARDHAQRVAVSIFVNPLQFGPQEDLTRYPQDLEGDLTKCSAAGVDLVFHPAAAAIYPAGFTTSVEVEALSRGLCSDRRPGHFRGVATLVLKLFHLFEPEVALFGEKDYQQLKVIQRMVLDLDLPIEVRGHPIVRESDGLAMSSRNSYLSPAERSQALSLNEGLRAAQRSFASGEKEPERLCRVVRETIEQAGGKIEYIALRDAQALLPVSTASAGQRLLVAAHIGRTRLIDNLELN